MAAATAHTAAVASASAAQAGQFPPGFPLFGPIRIVPLSDRADNEGDDADAGSFFKQFVKNQRKGFPFPQGQECEEDAHRVCPGVLRSCIGNFGCTMQCLTDHAPELSPACRRAHPCFPDFDKFCVDIPPGKNEMMKCLKNHAAELSSACLDHHPCLKPKADKNDPKVAEDCKKLDYSGSGPSFVGNAKDFLERIRSGDIFKPLDRLLSQKLPFGHPNRENSPRFPRFSAGSSPPAVEIERARRSLDKSNKLLSDAQKQFQEERHNLFNERKELEEERKLLKDEAQRLKKERELQELSIASSASVQSPLSHLAFFCALVMPFLFFTR